MSNVRGHMLVHVGGDGSHLALVDVKQYRSFVGRDWGERDQLYRHLVSAANQQSLLAWRTGFEADWRIEVSAGLTTRRGFREFSARINNTSDALYLVNYDSLTMAAQFDDHTLPDKETAQYQVPLSQGHYRVHVVQMFDPKSKWWESLGNSPAFLLEYEPCSPAPENAVGVHWWNDL